MSYELHDYAAIERTRKIDKSEFLRDARAAVIEWWKVMHPNTWYLRFISVDLWACGWWYQLRCTPFFFDLNHWFFKKWSISGSRLYGHFGHRIETPDIRFEL